MIEYFKSQSKSGNWAFQDQFLDDAQNPLWTSIPGDLVVTFTLKDRSGSQALAASSNDGSGKVGLATNGIVNVNFAPADLTSLDADMYDVFVKIVTGSTTIDKIYGRLPLAEGSGT